MVVDLDMEGYVGNIHTTTDTGFSVRVLVCMFCDCECFNIYLHDTKNCTNEPY